jgi:hypothetical protein
MTTSGFPMSDEGNTNDLTLRQLRELASNLGIGRYSRMLKDQLVRAIDRQSDAAPESVEQSTDLRALEAEMLPAPRPSAQTSVVFLPRDPQWAYVFWELSDADRRQAMADGASQLVLRVADVTGLGGGAAHQHTMQEVVVNSHATESRPWLGFRPCTPVSRSSISSFPSPWKHRLPRRRRSRPSPKLLPASTSGFTRPPRPPSVPLDAVPRPSMKWTLPVTIPTA